MPHHQQQQGGGGDCTSLLEMGIRGDVNVDIEQIN